MVFSRQSRWQTRIDFYETRVARPIAPKRALLIVVHTFIKCGLQTGRVKETQKPDMPRSPYAAMIGWELNEAQLLHSMQGVPVPGAEIRRSILADDWDA